MARTTLDLDSSVLRELRARAKSERKSMGQVGSELLATALADANERRTEPGPFRWRFGRLGKPRVDLEDKESVWAVLDGRDQAGAGGRP